MLRAMIFDCDGVIANNEPLHLRMFQKTLSEEGLPLTEKEYYETYLGMDDRGCFSTVLEKHDRAATPNLVRDLIRRKAVYFEEALRRELVLFPGVKEFVLSASRQYPLAVASGALRHEIETILRAAGIRKAFHLIVSAEDVSEGKPSPEGFLKALQGINDAAPTRRPPIQPGETLVIEDSIAGIQAAKSAGMVCVAVTNSYPGRSLRQADLVVDSLKDLRLETVQGLFWN
jgi:HAD superfamily hydrolase (TIGR01509 family)